MRLKWTSLGFKGPCASYLGSINAVFKRRTAAQFGSAARPSRTDRILQEAPTMRADGNGKYRNLRQRNQERAVAISPTLFSAHPNSIHALETRPEE